MGTADTTRHFVILGRSCMILPPTVLTLSDSANGCNFKLQPMPAKLDNWPTDHLRPDQIRSMSVTRNCGYQRNINRTRARRLARRGHLIIRPCEDDLALPFSDESSCAAAESRSRLKRTKDSYEVYETYDEQECMHGRQNLTIRLVGIIIDRRIGYVSE